MNLQKLASKYKTDKEHTGFLGAYSKKFGNIRNEVKILFEIGIHTGSSHLMWNEYFPNATIYGLDTFQREGDANNPRQCEKARVFKRLEPHNIIPIVGDQSNPKDLQNVFG